MTHDDCHRPHSTVATPMPPAWLYHNHKDVRDHSWEAETLTYKNGAVVDLGRLCIGSEYIKTDSITRDWLQCIAFVYISVTTTIVCRRQCGGVMVVVLEFWLRLCHGAQVIQRGVLVVLVVV